MCPKYMFYEDIWKKMSFFHIILSIKDSVQVQICFNDNIFGNRCCRSKNVSLIKVHMYILNVIFSFVYKWYICYS